MHRSGASLSDAVSSFHETLAAAFPKYERRPAQQQMTEQVIQAFDQHEIALIEAGTGTGKSFAYLLPALHSAATTGRPVIISTHTIALQEQLALRDLPFLLKALRLDLSVVLVKGMGNYFCWKKFDEEPSFASIFASSDKRIHNLEKWAGKAKEGSFSEIPFPIDSGLWKLVQAESETCTGSECPHHKKCFFFKARGHVEKGDLLIVNHHLLFADFLARSRGEGEGSAILPEADHLIVDEAHHFVPTARHSLSFTFDRARLGALLGMIASESGDKGVLRDLQKQIPLRREELFSAKQELFQSLQTTFSTLDHAIGLLFGSADKKRLTKVHMSSPIWKEKVVPSLKESKELLFSFTKQLFSFLEDVKQLLEKEERKGKGALFQLGQLTSRLEEVGERISPFLEEEPTEKEVLFFEKSLHLKQVKLTSSPLSLVPFFKEELFERFASTTFCSASLTTSGSFSYLRKELGLSRSPRAQEALYPSPFDYARSVYFALPSDLPSPDAPSFLSEVADLLIDAINIAKGGVFLLFTSYQMLHEAHKLLAPSFATGPIALLKQGEKSRTKLLEEFRESSHAVLFGTDSFWEGVDVPGDQLRLVIIVKLPFPVPTDPLLEAQADICRKEGGNPFMEIAIPETALKLKQGFGRLIRSETDRGCVILLDNRLQTKPYGKTLLDSLPLTQIDYAPWREVAAKMEEFYSERPS